MKRTYLNIFPAPHETEQALVVQAVHAQQVLPQHNKKYKGSVSKMAYS